MTFTTNGSTTACKYHSLCAKCNSMIAFCFCLITESNSILPIGSYFSTHSDGCAITMAQCITNRTNGDRSPIPTVVGIGSIGDIMITNGHRIIAFDCVVHPYGSSHFGIFHFQIMPNHNTHQGVFHLEFITDNDVVSTAGINSKIRSLIDVHCIC